MTQAAAPAVGLTRDRYHRYYWNDGPALPGVTSIVGIVNKPGLVNWAKRATAEAAVRDIEDLNKLVATMGIGDEVVRWLARKPDEHRDSRAGLGTRIHEMADAIVRRQPVRPTPEERPYLEAYLKFLRDRQPRIIVSELMVANLTLGYGGTLDLGVELDGLTTMLDIKTGGSIYDEVELQLSGYGQSEFGGWPGNPDPFTLPVWEAYGVVHLTPDEPVPYRLINVDVTPATDAVFRAALDLYKWKQAKQAEARRAQQP